MNKEIISIAQKAAVKTGIKLRKYSPEIMLVGAIFAGGAAIVTACIATKKAEPILEEANAELYEIEVTADAMADNEENDPKEAKIFRKQNSLKVYYRLICELTKVYGATIFLFLLFLCLTMGSHGILKKRYVSTTIAYKALDEAFKDYRKRMQEVLGEEKERYIFNGTEDGGEVTVIDENGNSQTTKQIVKTHDKKYTPYEFDFNFHTAPGNWEANSNYNLMFLRNAQNYCNDLLHSRGHVFLNEALDYIGLPRTREGAVVGWILGAGDDFVDFGIDEYYTDEYCDQQNGYIQNVHLNFNVDGVIWDKI